MSPPREKLDYDPSKGGFVVDIDKRQLEGAPYYKERDFGRSPDQAVGWTNTAAAGVVGCKRRGGGSCG